MRDKYDLIELFPVAGEIYLDNEGNPCSQPINKQKFELSLDDYLQAMMEKGSCNRRLVEDKLRRCHVYNAMKFSLSNSEAMKNYVLNHKHYNDNTELSKSADDVIKDKGRVLAPGQIVFHGGEDFRGEFLDTDRILSTSFVPDVAYWHAGRTPMNCKHQKEPYDTECDECGNPPIGSKGAIWCLTVSESMAAPALIIGHEDGNPNEAELVIASGVRIKLEKRIKKENWKFPLIYATFKCQ